MSIVRFSALRTAVHGVHDNGQFVHEQYERRFYLGKTEDYVEPEVPGGGYGPVLPGSVIKNWRELDERGFPREKSNFEHLVSSLVSPAIEKLRAAPVVVLVHGFMFDPRDGVSTNPADSNNPHSRIFHFLENPSVHSEIKDHTTGWPVRLGFDENDQGKNGLVVAFGWHSYPGFAGSLLKKGKNFYSRAYDNAEKTAWNLLTLVHELCKILPINKQIDLFCHSLGSRVVIRMISLAAKHGRFDILDRLGIAIILGGAEYVIEARHMLERLRESGQLNTVKFYNIVSRENDVLDRLAENFGPVTFGNSNVIGHNGLDIRNKKRLGDFWLDLQVDRDELVDWLKSNRRKFDITGDKPVRWDHWYYFTDPENMKFYASILRKRADWNISDLRKAGIPDKVERPISIWGD